MVGGIIGEFYDNVMNCVFVYVFVGAKEFGCAAYERVGDLRKRVRVEMG